MNVLVVDDEKLVRTGFIQLMPWDKFGMRVIGEASNGEMALEFLAEHPADLVITDLAMPVLTGIELMRILKERHPEIYVVVLSFHQEFELVQEALRLGAIDYIAKVQLEKERMEEVLARIAERIAADLKRKNTPTVLPAAVRGDFDEHTFRLLEKEWLLLDWLKEPQALNDLVERTKSLDPPAVRVRDLYHALLSEWEELFVRLPSGNRAEFAGMYRWSDWEEWLQRLKREFDAYFYKSAYSEEVTKGVMQAAKWMREHLDQPIKLDRIARQFSFSRSYFSHCFRDIMGRSFQKYLQEIRVEHARMLLELTDKPIQWVALESGFEDEKYFSQVFRAHCGALPSSYRKERSAGRK